MNRGRVFAVGRHTEDRPMNFLPHAVMFVAALAIGFWYARQYARRADPSESTSAKKLRKGAPSRLKWWSAVILLAVTNAVCTTWAAIGVWAAEPPVEVSLLVLGVVNVVLLGVGYGIGAAISTTSELSLMADERKLELAAEAERKARRAARE